MVTVLLKRIVPPAFVAIVLVASLVGTRLLLLAPGARALPPGGEDLLDVSAEVSIETRLGQETIPLFGTVSIHRGDPRMEGGLEVVDLEIGSLSLAAESITGPVTVSQSATLISSGEIRSLQPGEDFPASSFIDVFIEVDMPASPSRTNPLTVHNEEPLHLVPTSGGSEVPINAWPPLGLAYRAEPNPPSGSHLDPQTFPPGAPHCTSGLPLLPSFPAKVCLTSLAVTLFEGAPENPSYSVAPDGPSARHPADLLGLAAPPPGGPTPTPMPTATTNPAFTPTPTPVENTVSGNDDFADAWEITSLPFAGAQSTLGMTTEPGEPLNPNGCITFQPQVKGATVWYRFTASQSGMVTADTFDSLLDTVLAAYTGDAVNALTVLACNDDATGLQSQISFPVTAGTTYRLQVGGFDGSAGQLRLHVSAVSGAGAAGAGGAGEAPFARIPCANLGLTSDGCDDGADGDQDDLDALSYGADFTPGDAPIAFSVAPGSVGLAGTAVAGQAACSPPQPQADEFSTTLAGTNTLVFDGDGMDGDCPTATSLGLIEEPSSDDLDALNEQASSFVDSNGDSVPDEAVFFSLAADSPSLALLGRSAADILWTLASSQPGVYASASTLGLQSEDDIDALCLKDEGEGVTYEPAADTIFFSLASGSPTLAALGASAADVLGPGPEVLFAAGELGLQQNDDLDAMKCFSEPGPTPTPTVTRTPGAAPTATPTPTPTQPPPNGDANKDGTTNSIDATLVLQHVAGLIGPLPNSDVNQDGETTSVDATLILQFVAGLIPGLPV